MFVVGASISTVPWASGPPGAEALMSLSGDTRTESAVMRMRPPLPPSPALAVISLAFWRVTPLGRSPALPISMLPPLPPATSAAMRLPRSRLTSSRAPIEMLPPSASRAVVEISPSESASLRVSIRIEPASPVPVLRAETLAPFVISMVRASIEMSPPIWGEATRATRASGPASTSRVDLVVA
jgi:hypothetical protein